MMLRAKAPVTERRMVLGQKKAGFGVLSQASPAQPRALPPTLAW